MSDFENGKPGGLLIVITDNKEETEVIQKNKMEDHIVLSFQMAGSMKIESCPTVSDESTRAIGFIIQLVSALEGWIDSSEGRDWACDHEVKRALERLREAGDFLAGFSHELDNALQSAHPPDDAARKRILIEATTQHGGSVAVQRHANNWDAGWKTISGCYLAAGKATS